MSNQLLQIHRGVPIYNATQEKEVNSATHIRPLTHLGPHPDSWRGAVEGAEGPSPWVQVSVHLWMFLCEPAQAPCQSFMPLTSTMTSGNGVYNPLTPPVKYIIADIMPAADHFTK